MTVGKKIKQLRKARHMTGETLAERAGTSKASLYRWEAGDAGKMPVDVLTRIAEVLDTTPGYLLGFEQQQQRQPHPADLDDEEAILTYQGKPLSDEDKEMIRRIMRGK